MRRHAPAWVTLGSSVADCVRSIVAAVDLSNHTARYCSAIFSALAALSRSGITDSYIIRTLDWLDKEKDKAGESGSDPSAAKVWDKVRERMTTKLEPLSLKSYLWGLASLNIGFALMEAYKSDSDN